MSATIRTLPQWKKGSTAAEWLQEVAGLAMETPEKFGRIVVIYEQLNEQGFSVYTRQQSFNFEDNTSIMGALETGKLELYDYMKGRR